MKKRMYLTDQDKAGIMADYATREYTCGDLEKKYGKTRSSIYQFLRKEGVVINNDRAWLARKYTLNENYFDNIDTPEKAYWLGWLFSDGYNDEKRGVVVLSLQEGDKEILEKLNLLLGSNRPLQFQDNKNIKHQNVYKIVINSRQISTRLSELGCTQRKSLSLQFPTKECIPQKFMSHLIRGVYEGDGSLGFTFKNRIARKFKRSSVSITGTRDFLLGIQNVLKDIDISVSMEYEHKHHITSRIRILGGRDEQARFLSWLYKDAGIYILDRKYKKFQELLELNQSK